VLCAQVHGWKNSRFILVAVVKGYLVVQRALLKGNVMISSVLYALLKIPAALCETGAKGY
jgi:hypothetical protein